MAHLFPQTSWSAIMPIRAACPQCAAVYNLTENFVGKSVRCKKCETSFTVEDSPSKPSAALAVTEKAAKAQPAAPRLRDAEDPVRPAKSVRKRDAVAPGASDFPIKWLYGGGIGFVLIIVVGVGAFVLFRDKSPNSSSPLVQGGTINLGGGNKDGNKNDFIFPPVNGPGPGNPFNPPPFVPPPPFIPPPFVPPPPPVVPVPQPTVAWTAKPDRGAQPVEIQEKVPVVIPVTGAHLSLYPSAASPFVLVSQRAKGNNNSYEVWDLSSFKKTGEFATGNVQLTEPYALSQDGAFAASRVSTEFKPTVDVWSTANGQRIGRLVIENGPPGSSVLYLVDFAGPGQLVTSKSIKGDFVFQVWDLKTGQPLRSFTVGAHPDRKQIAVSAGGKYAAIFSKKNDRVLIYDLSTGARAGEAMVPKGQKGVNCQGLAFSPDGKTLAAMFAMFPESRLITWDMESGQVKADHTLKQSLQNLADKSFLYKGPPLEWLSDGSGLIAFGQLLIEVEKGAIFFKIPAEGLDGSQRRLFGTSRVARTKGDFRAQALTLDAMPSDQIASALKAAQSGADPAATKLPAAKPADWATARTLPPAGAAGAWKAVADAAPNRKQFVKSVPLQGKSGDLVRILFAAPDIGQAAVLTAAAPSDLVLQKQVRADRYDLVTGKTLGGIDLFAAEAPQGQQFQLDADVSPDGALLAVKEPKDGKRIDVWSLADGKHLAGWIPYEKDGDPVIRWVGFLGTGKVLTLNGAGKLVLWQVPDCRALWVLDGCRSAPAISSGRKYLAAFTGSTIELLDGTGERQGTLTGPALRSVLAAGFSADGTQFAAATQTIDGGTSLARWNAATGAAVDDFTVPANSFDVYHTEMKWCGNSHVMIQNSLVDLNLKWMTFTYNIPGFGRAATGSPDGRHWFAAAARPEVPPVLLGQSFPDDASKLLVQGVAAKTIQPVLSAGMAVSVRVEGATPAGVTEFHKRITESLKTKLQAHGLKIADKGNVELVITYQPERDTGRSMTFKSIGGIPRKPDTVVPIVEVVCEAKLSDANGGKIWERKQTMKTPEPFGIVRYEDIAGTLSKQMWQSCQSWGSSVGIPSSMIRTAAGVESLPKQVILTGDR
jgi:predicted Zn finger-like uncharacterized protein